MYWSQVDIHAPWGGVVPRLAQQAHEAAMEGTIAACMQQAGMAPQDLDVVAVTVGPGLSLCLKVPVSLFNSMPLVIRAHAVPAHAQRPPS